MSELWVVVVDDDDDEVCYSEDAARDAASYATSMGSEGVRVEKYVRCDDERLARLERRAKDWAVRQIHHSANGLEWGCTSCARTNVSHPNKLHAHNCDAAHILGLEMESER